MKDASFNFDLNYRFKIEGRTIKLINESKHKLDLSKFFSLGERRDRGLISNINAIVGPNGSGKTTLAFVLQQLAKGKPVCDDSIAIFKNDNRDFGGKDFYCSAVVKKGDTSYSLDTELESRCVCGPFRSWRKLVYYSPIYTPGHVMQGDEDIVFDVSTTAQMRKMPYEVIQEGQGRRGISASITYDTVEVRSILEVLNEKKMKGFFKCSPMGLKIAPSKYALALYQQEVSAAFVSTDDLAVCMQNSQFDADAEERTAVLGHVLAHAMGVGRLALSFALYAIGAIRTSFDKNEVEDYRVFFEYAKDLYIFCKTKFVSLKDDKTVMTVVSAFLNAAATKYQGCEDWYRGISLSGLIQGARDVLGMLHQLPYSADTDYKMGPTYHDFYIVPESEGLAADKISRLIAAHSTSAMHMDYLEFSLEPPLSSGELATLSMYGRILNALREMRCTQEGVLDALIYLDESETTLHPNLQRELVLNMIRFCERCTEDMDIQIVFASHSPLLLSDIPKGNVCFLADNAGGADDYMQELERLSNTFGANVLDLFRLGFFMRAGAVGGFVTEKLTHLISVLAKGDQLNDEDNVLVDLIGDSMVRSFFRMRIREAKEWRRISNDGN